MRVSETAMRSQRSQTPPEYTAFDPICMESKKG